MIVLSFITPKGYNTSGDMNNMSQFTGTQGGMNMQGGSGMIPIGNSSQGIMGNM